MSFFYAPPMTRVPDGASDSVRRRMYLEYVSELVRFNPHCFLLPGVKKRWWHLWKNEFPKCLLPPGVTP
jgi:hypothetical protein